MDYTKDLIQIVGEKNVKTDLIERLCYSRDLSVHEAVPDVIVFAKTTEEISKIMSLANKEKIPVTPRGSGTSSVGGALAAKGGILLDLSRMNQYFRDRQREWICRGRTGCSLQQSQCSTCPYTFLPS